MGCATFHVIQISETSGNKNMEGHIGIFSLKAPQIS